MTYIGVDGCRAGWFLVGLNNEGQSTFNLLTHITELDAYWSDAEMVLIDIPIGLRGRHPDERLCDKQARAVLGPGRGASVFPAPSRCALTGKTYQEANQRNKTCTGRGLSRQSYGILPKIREVDDYLRNTEGRGKIHEMHPEVCFWALNDQSAMTSSKKTTKGYAERIAVLSRYYSQASNVVEMAMHDYPGSKVARDDIVDALVGAVTARKAESLHQFPMEPEIDERGLVMKIVY